MKDPIIPKWSQVRIFSKTHDLSWYFAILRDILKPIKNEFPNSKIWFSQYICSIEADPCDTKAELLPTDFKNADQKTFSLKIRFESNEEIEKRIIRNSKAPLYWFSHFESFDYLSFSADKYGAKKELGRAKLISDLFVSNCSLVLDTVKEKGFEYNKDVNNIFTQGIAQSVLHMLANPHVKPYSEADPNVSLPIPLVWKPNQEVYPIQQC